MVSTQLRGKLSDLWSRSVGALIEELERFHAASDCKERGIHDQIRAWSPLIEQDTGRD
jgi:hypothetical protein